MGIRRRRKKLNTVMTSIDRRLKHVELRRVPRIVKDGSLSAIKFTADVQAILSKSEKSADVADNTGVGTVAPVFIPIPYIKIIKVEYRGFNLTNLDDDLATVYFDGNPGVAKDDYMMFSGFTTFLDASTTTPTEYKITEAGLVVGGDFDGKYYARYFPGQRVVQRATLTLTKGVRIRASKVTMAGGELNGTVTTYSRVSIEYDIGPESTSDVSLGPNWVSAAAGSGSRFTEYAYSSGDNISIDGLGFPFDGTFKVHTSNTVGSTTTLEYTLNTPVVGPVTLPSTNGALRASGARLTRNGETYTDTSSGAAITYVWDDKLNKWWNPADPALPEGVVVDDGLSPAAPTSLSGDSTGYVLNGPKAKIELTWTAPTTNSDGTPLNDLMGYKVYYKLTSQTGAYTFASDTGSVTSATILDLTSETSYSFVVTAYDKSKRESVYSTAFVHITAKGALDLDRPSAPVLTSRLGVITAKWDGKNSSGVSMAGSTTLTVLEFHKSTTSGFTPDDTTLISVEQRATATYIDSAVEYNTNYYYKLIARDTFGSKSIASAESILQVKPLVNGDLVASTLTTWPFNGKVVNAAALADGSVSGSTLISGTPENGVWSLGALAAGSIAANDMAANSIIAGKIAANAITAGTISANAITAVAINANAITSDKILAGAINAQKIQSGSITTDRLQAGVLTGFTVNTATSGQRVQLTTSFVSFFDSNDVRTGVVVGESNTLTVRNVVGVTSGIAYSGSSAQLVLGSGTATWQVLSGGFGSTVTLEALAGLTATGNITSNNQVKGGSLSSTGGTYVGGVLEVTGISRIKNVMYYPGFATAPTFTSGTPLHLSPSTIGEGYKIGILASSRRFKENIQPLEDASYLDKISSLVPVTFNYKGDLTELAFGLIAEDVLAAGLDGMVNNDLDDDGNSVPFSLMYDRLAVYMIPAIKELNERLKRLEGQ